jgi:hypothetical protein
VYSMKRATPSRGGSLLFCYMPGNMGLVASQAPLPRRRARLDPGREPESARASPLNGLLSRVCAFVHSSGPCLDASRAVSAGNRGATRPDPRSPLEKRRRDQVRLSTATRLPQPPHLLARWHPRSAQPLPPLPGFRPDRLGGSDPVYRTKIPDRTPSSPGASMW